MDSHKQIKKRKLNPPDTLAHQSSDGDADQVNEQDRVTSLPIELTNATGTHLDQLNDDCLLEIFSEKSLTLMDLCSLAETCKLFKGICQRVFPKELTIEHAFSLKYSIKSKNREGLRENAQNVERIFKHFGARLVALSVIGYASAPTVTNLIARHCVGTLKELELNWIQITDVLATVLKPIFQQLQLLSIRHTMVVCSANMFANCDSLIELRIRQSCRCAPILESNFPKLQRFTLIYRQGLSDFKFEPLLLNFFQRQKALKRLHLDSTSFDADVFLQNGGNMYRELEEMEIAFSTEYGLALDFSHFQSLKQLRVHSGFGICNALQLHELKSLEVLEIGGEFYNREVFQALPLLTNLRELDVNLASIRKKLPWTSLTQLTKLRIPSAYLHAFDNVVDIIRLLGNIEELQIYNRNLEVDGFVLSEEEFYEIVKLVEERPQVLTLICKFEISKSSEAYFKVKLIEGGW